MSTSPRRRARPRAAVGLAGVAAGCLMVLAPAGLGATTERVSVTSSGAQGSGGNVDALEPSVSESGRFVAFQSTFRNLVPNDTNGDYDIFLRDRQTGTTERVSVNSKEGQGNEFSQLPDLSPDGRFVVFQSDSTNLVPGDTNARKDIFIRDRTAGTTERVSVASDGGQADGTSQNASVSADGRFVAFESWATDLVPGDTNGTLDVFIRDRVTGLTERVAVATGGAEADDSSWGSTLSADGRLVAFGSFATDLRPDDRDGTGDVFVRDREHGDTRWVSRSTTGRPAARETTGPVISADGRFVAFESLSATLVTPFEDDIDWDVFVHDRLTGVTERVSLSSNETEGTGYWSGSADISPDGRLIAFVSDSPDLVPGDTNGVSDVLVRDRVAGTTTRLSVGATGAQAGGASLAPSISADGKVVAFNSGAANLVPGDTNGRVDVFVRDQGPACTPRASLSTTASHTTTLRLCVPTKDVVAKIRVAGDKVSGDMNPKGGRIPLTVRVNGTVARLSTTAAGYWFSARRPSGTVTVSISSP